MDLFKEALFDATRRIIESHLYIGPPDDIDDVSFVAGSEELPELQRLNEAIASDEVVRRALAIPPEEEVPDGFAFAFMPRWLSEYRDLTGTLVNFDERKGEELFERFPAAASLDHVQAVATAPLFEFRSAIDTVELTDNVAIEALASHPEVRRSVDRTRTFSWYFGGMAGGVSHAIRVRFAVRAEGGVDFGPEMDRCDRVLWALRLAKPGPVHVGSYVFEAQPPSFRLPYTFSPYVNMRRSLPSGRWLAGDFYELGADEAPVVRALFLKLEEQTDDESLTFALRHYSAAQDRVSPGDEIVDCWIALEALFAADSNQEVAFRASLRAAKFIGGEEDDRSEIYARLKRLYNTRSRVVHGDYVEQARLKQDASDTLEYLRRSLIRWTTEGRQSPADFDRLLLR